MRLGKALQKPTNSSKNTEWPQSWKNLKERQTNSLEWFIEAASLKNKIVKYGLTVVAPIMNARKSVSDVIVMEQPCKIRVQVITNAWIEFSPSSLINKLGESV